jgi:hypothetical protein
LVLLREPSGKILSAVLKTGEPSGKHWKTTSEGGTSRLLTILFYDIFDLLVLSREWRNGMMINRYYESPPFHTFSTSKLRMSKRHSTA